MSLSTLTAAPAATLANGIPTSALVVTANDAYGNLLRAEVVEHEQQRQRRDVRPVERHDGCKRAIYPGLVKGTKLAAGTQQLSATLGAAVLNMPFAFRML